MTDLPVRLGIDEVVSHGSIGTAVLDTTGIYRYYLSRQIATAGPSVLWIMANPSTADGDSNDPTIRRAIGFSTSWGCSKFGTVNLYAYRTPYPKALWEASYTGIDIIGPGNIKWITESAKRSDIVVCGWGAIASRSNSDHAAQVTESLKDAGVALTCLGTTKAGHPKHPLYLRKDTERVPFAE